MAGCCFMVKNINNNISLLLIIENFSLYMYDNHLIMQTLHRMGLQLLTQGSVPLDNDITIGCTYNTVSIEIAVIPYLDSLAIRHHSLGRARLSRVEMQCCINLQFLLNCASIHKLS